VLTPSVLFFFFFFLLFNERPEGNDYKNKLSQK